MADGSAGDLGHGGNSSFPLSKGAEARIARLRGYGDGIVAQVAEGFIRAYMEISGEGTLTEL